VKINFINPFGTEAFNNLIQETLKASGRSDTTLVVSNTTGCPENIDYYYAKHLVEEAVFESVIDAEKAGFDAVIVGCCYDPGVRVARELVDIPVIGPLEASIHFAPYFGHDYVVVTDHRKAVPYLRDLVALYGGAQCRGVSCIDWYVTDMIRDTAAVARDAEAAVRRVLEQSGAEVAIFGCTIISASYEKFLIDTGRTSDVTILNPNTMALKMAEALGDLKRVGAYNINRTGFYQKHQQHNASEFKSVRDRFGRRTAED
jgi:allantoin racemase